MPTQGALPIPAAMLPAGPLNPYDWLSLGNEAGGIQQGAVMRGHPGALSAYQRRQIAGPTRSWQGRADLLAIARPMIAAPAPTRPKFGVLNINPDRRRHLCALQIARDRRTRRTLPNGGDLVRRADRPDQRTSVADHEHGKPQRPDRACRASRPCTRRPDRRESLPSSLA